MPALPDNQRKRLQIPWTALAISGAVGVSGALAVPPIREAATHADVVNAYLVRPLGYVGIAPVSNALDMLTLLSLRQHAALLLGVVILFAIWRLARARFAKDTGRSHLIASGSLVAVILVVYAPAAVLPRPMVSLATDNNNLVRVDFHSHTSASHDGRPGWDAERNRAWHRDAGFDVAYITDHATVSEAERGMAANPNPAGEGVTLLQAIEVTWAGEHVAILGAQRMYKGILTENLRDVDVRGLEIASLLAGREPVVIWNHPRNLGRLPIAIGPGTPGVRAIEIVNGSPDDMNQVQTKRLEIVALAQQHDIPVTGGSDNHGWGRATPGWTLVPVVGWRTMYGDALAYQIENVLRAGKFTGTVVVERRVADPGASKLALAFTVFAAPARMLTTLSADERVAWLIWTWLVTTTVWWIRRTRSQRPV